MIKRNNLFGNHERHFYLFLQNLRSKKDKNLFNSNLIQNYYLHNFILNIFKTKKHFYLLSSLFFLKKNFFFINPVFNFNKQLFNNGLKCNDFLLNYQAGAFYIKKKNFNFLYDGFGLNYCLFSKNDVLKLLGDDESKIFINLKCCINGIND
jgi:hypothetical protein